MKPSKYIQFLSLLMSVLLMWNLFGWWLYPVAHGLVEKHFYSGIECCNGAELCCCKSAGADACYCLPNQAHDDKSPMVCGISAQENQTNAKADGILVFIDLRATISDSIIIAPWYHTKHLKTFVSESPISGFYLDLFRPPQV